MSWTSQIDWDTPAGRTLRKLFETLPTGRQFSLTLFSSPIQLGIEPTFLKSRWAVLLLAALILAGCVSPKERELRGREARYRSTLATLPSESRRSDLCRLLPPIAKAKPHNIDLAIPRRSWPDRPGFVLNVSPLTSAILGCPPAENFGWEEHPLDVDFYISVAYEYRKYRRQPALPRHRNSGLHLDLNAIDALLYGIDMKPRRSFRVYPSPHDRIVLAPPTLLRSTSRTIPKYAVYAPEVSPTHAAGIK